MLNNEDVFTQENKKAKKYEDVKVYAGDPWYNPVDAKIRNLTFETKDEGTPSMV